jgi:hypothetical protein
VLPIENQKSIGEDMALPSRQPALVTTAELECSTQ